MSTNSSVLSALSELGKYLTSFPDELKAIMQVAEQHNGWFTQQQQQKAITEVVNHYLQPNALQEFATTYNTPVKESKNVAVVMAGNLPLVGIHDVICVLVSGHNLIAKLSSKDNKLMKAVLLKLQSLLPNGKEKIVITEGQLPKFNAVIATGSNNSARYFEEYFGKYPHIIRKNRSSIAVLTGKESDEELLALGNDIFSYYGLGCRNVTKLFVPQGYDFTTMLELYDEHFGDLIGNNKYKNNYDYNLTLLILNKIPYLNNKVFIVTEDKNLHSRIAIMHYQEYQSIDEVNNWIIEHNQELQVIVGEGFSPFGSSQQPSLTDYADGVDTMEFLMNL